MNIKKKGASLAFTATLLASLLATVAAPVALGAISLTNVGNVPRGGASTTTFSITFTESTAACLTDGLVAGTNDLVLDIKDSAAGDTVTFSGTPVVSAPGSAGASATVGSGVADLTVQITGQDAANVEPITVSGLTINAPVGTALGAMTATLSATSPALLACFQAGGTATGTIASGIGVGATSVIVNVTSGGCIFVDPGTLAFATSPESRAITAASLVGVPAAGQQTLTIAATANVHNAGEVVSEATACAPTGVLASPGTVVDSAIYARLAQPTIVPGETNQAVGSVTISERAGSFGFLAAGSTITLTITTAGVTFSTAPTPATDDNSTFALASPTGALSPDLKSATWTVGAASTSCTGVPPNCTTITFAGLLYDVAASVPIGTAVNLTAALSGGRIVTPTSVSNAVVGRVIVGVGASPVPTIYINENNQASALITLTESGAGFFTDGTGSNNILALCLLTSETFTLAPWAVVTAGDLRLREGAIASPDNIVQGTAFSDAFGNSCVYWTVWTKSTVASTIEIRGTDPASPGAPLPSGPTNGPRLSVGPVSTPGTTQAGIRVGTFAAVVTAGSPATQQSLVVIAVRAFRSGVVVAAVTQPVIDRGDTDALAGNITITETLNGQFKPGQVIFVQVLARASTLRQDVLMNTANTNNLPIITTNGASGLAVSPPTFGGITPNPIVCQNAIPLIAICGFAFTITQQSFGPTLGQITISNLHYFVLADAVNGAVQVQVSSSGVAPGPNGVAFQSVVSNARVGAAQATQISNGSSTGVRVAGDGAVFTSSTKIVQAGKYVTWRADMDPATAGERLEVWIARRDVGSLTWSPFVKVTTRAVNSAGLAFFHWKTSDTSSPFTNQAGWISVRFKFLGNANHAAFTSLSRQAHFTP